MYSFMYRLRVIYIGSDFSGLVSEYIGTLNFSIGDIGWQRLRDHLCRGSDFLALGLVLPVK